MKIFLKSISFLLLFSYLIIDQLYSFSQETKLIVLPILIVASIISFIIRIKAGESFKNSQLLMLSISLLVTFVIFSYFLKTSV